MSPPLLRQSECIRPNCAPTSLLRKYNGRVCSHPYVRRRLTKWAPVLHNSFVFRATKMTSGAYDSTTSQTAKHAP